MMFCLKSQKIKYEKLPFDFKERLVHLASLKDIPNLGKACPDVKSICNLRPEFHDQLKIVESSDVYQSAARMVFWFGILRLFKSLQYYYDGPWSTIPIWGSVLSVDEIVDRNKLIYVQDTLVLHCESSQGCKKVIPFITGPYSRLIVDGHITWKQAKQLITANVKQVRIDARIHFWSKERKECARFIDQFCRGTAYKFTIDSYRNNYGLLYELETVFDHHPTFSLTKQNHGYHITHNLYTWFRLIFVYILSWFLILFLVMLLIHLKSLILLMIFTLLLAAHFFLLCYQMGVEN